MKITIQPGIYVVATSGGVDSMTLLDMLRRQKGLKLIVAHFDHGIRSDSAEDRKLVQQTAARHGMQFVYHEGNLGRDTSEDDARKARYDFLHKVRVASDARAIITAHHQDDLLETAIYNMLRGTNRRGMIALRNREYLLRPLLDASKHDLVTFAKHQGLQWRDDTSNNEMRYSRNYIRHRIVPLLSEKEREVLLGHIRNIENLNEQLEHQLANHLHLHPGRTKLDRHLFILLPHAVAREVLASWLRTNGITELNTGMLERLVVAAKTYRNDKQADIDSRYVFYVGPDYLTIRTRDR